MKSQAIAALLLAGCLCPAFADSSDEPNRGPVQAELLKPLHVRHLSKGATVFARVTLDWSGPNCFLRQGSILEATAEVSEPHKPRTDSRLSLSFTRAQCNGADMRPMNLVLAAVADAPVDWKTVPDSQFRMPLSFSNPHPSGMLAGIGGAAPGDLYSTHVEMMGILHRFPMNSNVKPGDVLGLKGVKLDIGAGPNRSSVLTSRNHDLSFVAYTQLLLVPADVVFGRSKLTLISSSSSIPLDRPAARTPSSVIDAIPPDSLDICAPPGCAVDLPVTANDLAGRSAASIAIRPLGYAPRSNKVQGEFEDEETLAWLGPQQILFAFNPHPLVRRGESSGAAARVIRAVLLDAQTRQVLRAVDWEVTDRHRYLWQLDGNRILAHIGNELRVYRAGLEVEQQIPLDGPLAFIRLSPNGELMAVATLRERHSRELHARLREELGTEPEEDVHIAILDRTFRKIGETTTISSLQAPTLLNEGQAKLLAQPGSRYRIAMSTWDNKNDTLARFESFCTPELSSIAPNLLFLLTCNVKSGEAEYRAIRADGKLLLRGNPDAQIVGHEAMGSDRLFAVKVVHTARAISPGAEFKGADLDSQEVRVYRASDGKRLLAVRVNDPVASHGSFALSPDGAQLAVLSGTQIRFFPVPAN